MIWQRQETISRDFPFRTQSSLSTIIPLWGKVKTIAECIAVPRGQTRASSTTIIHKSSGQAKSNMHNSQHSHFWQLTTDPGRELAFAKLTSFRCHRQLRMLLCRGSLCHRRSRLSKDTERSQTTEAKRLFVRCRVFIKIAKPYARLFLISAYSFLHLLVQPHP